MNGSARFWGYIAVQKSSKNPPPAFPDVKWIEPLVPRPHIVRNAFGAGVPK